MTFSLKSLLAGTVVGAITGFAAFAVFDAYLGDARYIGGMRGFVLVAGIISMQAFSLVLPFIALANHFARLNAISAALIAAVLTGLFNWPVFGAQGARWIALCGLLAGVAGHAATRGMEALRSSRQLRITPAPVARLATPDARLPLWRAMSDLFLDTQTEDYMYRDIVQEIRASGLTLAEAESVFWNEVYPGLWLNLLSMTGVWGGFDPRWLRDCLKVKPMRKPRRRLFPWIASEMRGEWARVVAEYEKGAQHAAS